MKTAEEILQPFVETPLRHTKVVEKDNALKAMKMFADQFKKVIDWRTITTFEQVCEAAGEDPADYFTISNGVVVIPDNLSKRQKGKELYSMKELICDVFKEGVVLDYADAKQKKHYPWGEYKPGSGFSLYDVLFVYTDSFVGARLCVDSDEKARHIWTHFNCIDQVYWLDK